MKKRFLVTILVVLVDLLTSCGVSPNGQIIKNEGFPLSERWSFPLNGSIYGLAVSDDRVAVSQSNGITAIDTKTGSYLWDLSSPVDIDSVLLFLDENLIVASSSQIMVIDKSGQELSTINFDSPNERAQVVAGYSDYVFVRRVPSWTLEIYDVPQGTLAWEIPAGRGTQSITFDEVTNTIYLTTTRFVSAHDISNGNLIWKIDTNTNTGIFEGGVIYYSSDLRKNENIIPVSAVDVRSLDLLWDAQIPYGVRTAIYNLTVYGNMLIVGTNSGLLSVDKKDGHELWQSETNDSFDAKPIIINDMLYARATNTSMIYAISPADGRYLGYLKLGESSLLGISHPEYDILYQTGEFLIFPFENTVYAYQ